MNNRPIIITGCQRSGTTLLHLILDSHPDVRGMDEWEVKPDLFYEYLTLPRYASYLAMKLPKAAHLAPALPVIPGIKVLWCLRDPRDVVTSMLKLKYPTKVGVKKTLLWSLSHRTETLRALAAFKPVMVSASWVIDAADKEIHHAIKTLQHRALLTEELRAYVARYKEIRKKHPFRQTHAEQVFLGALCWRLKQEIFRSCCHDQEVFYVVQYERLIQHPQEEIRRILQFVNLPWHDAVLQHHALHKGVSVGQTDNTRPIDATNLNKWRGFLSDDDARTIKTLCAKGAEPYYSF